MRGLPFNATEDDIHEFFIPLRVISITMLSGRDNRPSGECQCFFETEQEAAHALTYNKKYMGSRYIEIFANKGNNTAIGGGSAGNRAMSSLMDLGHTQEEIIHVLPQVDMGEESWGIEISTS